MDTGSETPQQGTPGTVGTVSINGTGTRSADRQPDRTGSRASHSAEMGSAAGSGPEGNRPERPASGVVTDKSLTLRSPGQGEITATRVRTLVKRPAVQHSTPQRMVGKTPRSPPEPLYPVDDGSVDW